jgi:hypothetical protein
MMIIGKLILHNLMKQKTERAITNEQSKDACAIGHKTQNNDEQSNKVQHRQI